MSDSRHIVVAHAVMAYEVGHGLNHKTVIPASVPVEDRRYGHLDLAVVEHSFERPLKDVDCLAQGNIRAAQRTSVKCDAPAEQLVIQGRQQLEEENRSGCMDWPPEEVLQTTIERAADACKSRRARRPWPDPCHLQRPLAAVCLLDGQLVLVLPERQDYRPGGHSLLMVLHSSLKSACPPAP